jgi:hypothetical protein
MVHFVMFSLCLSASKAVFNRSGACYPVFATPVIRSPWTAAIIPALHFFQQKKYPALALKARVRTSLYVVQEVDAISRPLTKLGGLVQLYRV